MRAVLLFLVLWGLATAAVFGYKYVTKNDIKVTGKLAFAGVIAAVFAVVIYLGELG